MARRQGLFVAVLSVVTLCGTGLGVGDSPTTTRRGPGRVKVLTVVGTIDPAVADYVVENIADTSAGTYECVVIELNTPGGLMTSMQEIVKAILNSEVPVATFVSPDGAKAGSAGTFIVLASHVAAMAPGTNIGAAHPVNLGGEQSGGDMAAKMENDAASYIVSLAERRGRNAEWAEKAVRESASVPANEAVDLNVVDLIAGSVPDLLNRIDGREVQVSGARVRLHTRGSEIVHRDPTWVQNFLHAISHPQIAYVLLMLGIWGLYFELANPGAVLPGVIGGVCLILGMYALYVLPTNLAGVLLIILAIVLFIAELKTTTNGVLTVGGIASFVLGSFMLFPATSPFGAVPWELIVVCSGTTAGFFMLVLWLVVKAQRSRIVMGVERLSGLRGTTQSALRPDGVVLVQGEQWSAESLAGPLTEGQKIEVVAVEGLTLKVRPVQ